MGSADPRTIGFDLVGVAISGRPRIDEADSQLLEVPDVAGRQPRSSGRGDPGNLHIADVETPSRTPSLGSDADGGDCGRPVERLDAATEVFVEELSEGLLELPPAPARLQQLQPGTHLEDGDRGHPDRLRRLLVQPGDDDPIGLPLHQRRDDVRVEEDHGSKRAGVVG